jgi:integrase
MATRRRSGPGDPKVFETWHTHVQVVDDDEKTRRVEVTAANKKDLAEAVKDRVAAGALEIPKVRVWRTYTTFIELPPGPDGKRRRKKISAKTQGQVTTKRNAARGALSAGRALPNDRITVAQAVERWLGSRRKVTASTLKNYKTMAKNHIIPTAVGRKQLNVLTDDNVNALLDHKAETLSPRSVKLIRTILSASINLAQLRGDVPRNVVRETEAPELGQTKHRAMTEKQRDAVLKAATGTRYEAAFRIMLVLGLRPGECLGLQWADIDFKAKTLTVRHGLKRDGSLGDVKSDGSRRQLPLPASAIPSLKARNVAQKEDQLKAGEYWQNKDDLVFTTTIGTPVSDRNLADRSGRAPKAGRPRNDFAYICAQAKVGTWHLHECRHTAATIMLINKVPIEVVSKVLGHRSIRQTADTYAHLLPRQLEEAVATIERGLLEVVGD